MRATALTTPQLVRRLLVCLALLLVAAAPCANGQDGSPWYDWLVPRDITYSVHGNGGDFSGNRATLSATWGVRPLETRIVESPAFLRMESSFEALVQARYSETVHRLEGELELARAEKESELARTREDANREIDQLREDLAAAEDRAQLAVEQGGGLSDGEVATMSSLGVGILIAWFRSQIARGAARIVGRDEDVET